MWVSVTYMIYMDATGKRTSQKRNPSIFVEGKDIPQTVFLFTLPKTRIAPQKQG